TNVTTNLSISSSTVNGPGIVTNAAGKSLTLLGSTINAALVNQGTLLVEGTSAVNGVLTAAAGSTLRVQGDNAASTAALTVDNGFSNNGTIILQSSDQSFASNLTVTSGTLTNAVGGIINVNVGTGGGRTLTA